MRSREDIVYGLVDCRRIDERVLEVLLDIRDLLEKKDVNK